MLPASLNARTLLTAREGKERSSTVAGDRGSNPPPSSGESDANLFLRRNELSSALRGFNLGRLWVDNFTGWHLLPGIPLKPV